MKKNVEEMKNLFFWQLSKAIAAQLSSFVTQDFRGLDKILTDLYADGWIIGFTKTISTKKPIRRLVTVYLRFGTDARLNIVSVKKISQISRNAAIRIHEVTAEVFNEPFGAGIIETPQDGWTTTKCAHKKKRGGNYIAKIR